MSARNRIVPPLCALVLLASCDVCSDNQVSHSDSPDHQLVANVYERNCGATTDFSSIVNLQNVSEKFNGNEDQLFIAKGRYSISVEWKSPRLLVINCQDCSRQNIFREVTALGDIDVSYMLASTSK